MKHMDNNYKTGDMIEFNHLKSGCIGRPNHQNNMWREPKWKKK